MTGRADLATPGPFVPLHRRGHSDPAALRNDARTRFDRVAAAYDLARPKYPAPLFDALRDEVLPDGGNVLEIGCGTGQATADLAVLSDRVVCVELGPQLARIARANLAEFSHVEVIVGAFEDVDLPDHSFDLVFSATAFHWIDPSVGYPRAAGLLSPQGSLALVTHANIRGGTEDQIAGCINALHEQLAPEIGPWSLPSAGAVEAAAIAPGDICTVWSRVDRCFHEPIDVSKLFHPPRIRTYEWTATYTRDEYLAFLGTQSSYIALDDTQRAQLFGAIGELVDEELGGAVTKAFLTVAAVARRR